MTPRATTGVVGLFAVLTFIFTIPLSLDPGGRALDLGADTRLFLWTLAWDVHALVSQPWSLFQANIFFPAPDTLAYSEHLLGTAILGAPWLAATGNPLLALNVVLLISCVGAGAGTYFLARRVGVGVAGALAAGVIFAFAPPRFFRLAQAHLAVVLWMPLCLGFLHTYAAGGSRKHLLAAAAFFTLQALSGGQLGLFLAFAAGGFLLYARVFGLLRPRGRLLPDFGLATVLVITVNLPFFLPYLRVQEESGLSRSLDEAREWSPNAASFLAAPTHVQRYLLSIFPGLERSVMGTARAYLFPGFLTLLLALVSLRRVQEISPVAERAPPPAQTAREGSARWRRWPSGVVALDGLLIVSALITLFLVFTGGIRWQVGGVTISARGAGRAAFVFVALSGLRLTLARRSPFAFRELTRRVVERVRIELSSRMGIQAGYFFFLAVFSFWIALGPSFGLYAALYRIVPGFDFIRVPSRFTLLTVLSLAVLAGVGLERLLGSVRASRRRLLGPVAIGILGILLLEFAAFPLDAPPYSFAIPPIDRWIAREAQRSGPFAVVELPVPDPRDAAASARWHSLYMLHSTAHWQGLVNGYSGFTPPTHDALFRKLVNFPDEASIGALEQMGVRYAVIHRDAFDEDEWRDVKEKLQIFDNRLRLVAEEGNGLAYSLTRSKKKSPDHES